MNTNLDIFRSLMNNEDYLPACELEEKDDQYLISMDVPGIPKDQIKVELTGNTLTISGERKEEKKEGKGKRQLVERRYGSFERSFQLPGMAANGKVDAHYENGVLKIALPKAQASQTRRIEVGGAKPAQTRAA